MQSYFCLFFFKQKTAYELRISDWSSDVCSSDLVIPARLAGRRGTAGVEVTLHQAVDADGPGGSTWKVFARPARKLGLGDTIDFGGGFTAEVVGKGEAGEVTLTFHRRGGALPAALEKQGIMPLPPYIPPSTEERWVGQGCVRTFWYLVLRDH